MKTALVKHNINSLTQLSSVGEIAQQVSLRQERTLCTSSEMGGCPNEHHLAVVDCYTGINIVVNLFCNHASVLKNTTHRGSQGQMVYNKKYFDLV